MIKRLAYKDRMVKSLFSVDYKWKKAEKDAILARLTGLGLEWRARFTMDQTAKKCTTFHATGPLAGCFSVDVRIGYGSEKESLAAIEAKLTEAFPGADIIARLSLSKTLITVRPAAIRRTVILTNNMNDKRIDKLANVAVTLRHYLYTSALYNGTPTQSFLLDNEANREFNNKETTNLRRAIIAVNAWMEFEMVEYAYASSEDADGFLAEVVRRLHEYDKREAAKRQAKYIKLTNEDGKWRITLEYAVTRHPDNVDAIFEFWSGWDAYYKLTALRGDGYEFDLNTNHYLGRYNSMAYVALLEFCIKNID